MGRRGRFQIVRESSHGEDQRSDPLPEDKLMVFNVIINSEIMVPQNCFATNIQVCGPRRWDTCFISFCICSPKSGLRVHSLVEVTLPG